MKKKFIVVLLIIVIIISGVIGLGIHNIMTAPQETLKAIPNADKEIARAGDTINFTAENSKGDIKNYFWNFSDGNTSTEVDPSHVFDIPGWYNVTLTIEGKSSNKANSTLIIGIQRNDVFEEGEGGIYRDFNPINPTRLLATVADIGPSIGLPTVECQCDVYRAVGDLEFEISLRWVVSQEENIILVYIANIYTDSTFARGEDVLFSYIVRPGELPEEMQIYESSIRVSVSTSNGRWDGYVITINAAFPMDNLYPF